MAKETVLEAPIRAETANQAPTRLERVWRKVGMAAAIGAVALTGVGSEKISAKESPNSLSYPNATLLERSYVDRPDAVSGPQVHLIYGRAADGADLGYDTNGTLENLWWNTQDYASDPLRLAGQGLRADTTLGGHLDITAVQFDFTEATMANQGLFALYSVRDGLWSKGYTNDPNKTNLVLLQNGPCGVATWPPSITGNVAIVGVGPNCGPLQTRGVVDRHSLGMIHEVYHTKGAVPLSAPNSDGKAHSTEFGDVMGSSTIAGATVDKTRKNYYDLVSPLSEIVHRSVSVDFTGEGEVRADPLANSFWGKGIKVNQPVAIGEKREPYCTDDCELWFRPNDEVTLSAESHSPIWEFEGWRGACESIGKCVVSLADGPQSAKANFKELSVLELEVKGGVVKVAGEAACKSECSYDFEPGDKIRLEAMIDPKKRIRWSNVGNCATKRICTYTAQHEVKRVKVTISKIPLRKSAKKK